GSLFTSTRTKPNLFVPGPIGGESPPVPSTESCGVLPMRAWMDPDGLEEDVFVPPRLHATPTTPTPRARRNCRRLGRDPRPGRESKSSSRSPSAGGNRPERGGSDKVRQLLPQDVQRDGTTSSEDALPRRVHDGRHGLPQQPEIVAE